MGSLPKVVIDGLIDHIKESVTDTNEITNDHFDSATDAYDSGVFDAIWAVRKYFGE